MWKVLIAVGPVTIYTYGFMMAAAFLLGIWLAARRAAAFGYTSSQVHDGALPILALSLLGAKLAYLAAAWNDVVFDWREALAVIRGGFIFYGGLAGGVAGGLWWLRRRGLPALAFGDLIAPPLCFAHALGRLGCFLNGCCYGKAAAWGIVLPEVDRLPRMPAQLFEAGGLVALGAALSFLRPGAPGRTGRILAAYLLGYGALRFAVEFTRDDPRGAALGGLSPSQWLALVAGASGVVLFLVRRRDG